MGVFHVELEIGDPLGERYESVEALVDSGAVYTFLPSSLLSELGVEPLTTRSFVLADGTRIQREIGQTWVQLDGERLISPVIFGDDNATPLLGAVTMEIFSLGIDMVNMRLIPVDAIM